MRNLRNPRSPPFAQIAWKLTKIDLRLDNAGHETHEKARKAAISAAELMSQTSEASVDTEQPAPDDDDDDDFL